MLCMPSKLLLSIRSTHLDSHIPSTEKMMSILILPGRESEYEGAEWWQLTGILNSTYFEQTNTKPFLVEAEGSAGERAEWVLKPLSRLTKSGSVCELVGHRFAAAVGIPVLDYGIVEISSHVAARAPMAQRETLTSSLGPNFATRYRAGVTDITDPSEIRQAWRRNAKTIYGWDMIVDNADRRVTNSNLLASDAGVIAIDHQFVFSWLMDIAGPHRAWNPDILHRLAPEHFLSTSVCQWEERLDGLAQAISGLSADAVDSLTQGIPSLWTQEDDGEKLNQIRFYLSDIHARASTICEVLDRRRTA
jgi:hypothetical protein